MTEDFIYNKMASAPSDYSCNDGDLSLSKNVVSKYNEIAPIPKPTEFHNFNKAVDVLYIHHTTDGDFYICSNTNDNNAITIYAIDNNNKEDMICSGIGNKILGIKSIGNVLIISTDTKLNYIRYKADTKQYLYIGDHIPTTEIAFGLELNLIKKDYDAHLSLHPQSTMQYNLRDWGKITIGKNNSDVRIIKIGSIPYYVIKASMAKEFTANTEYYRTTQTSDKYLVSSFLLIGKKDNTYNKIFGHKDRWFTIHKTYDEYYIGILQRNDTSEEILKNSFESFSIKEGFKQSIVGNVVEYTKANFDALVGYREKFVALYGAKDNKFMHPFFVRYALRLFNNTFVQISSPILMIPNSDYAPLIGFNESSPSPATYRAFVAKLKYKIVKGLSQEWKDIVSSIDIFVSSPIYPYDGGAEYEETKTHFTFIAKEKNSTGEYDFLGTKFFGIGLCSDTELYRKDGYTRVDMVELSNVLNDNDMGGTDNYSCKFVKVAEESIQDKIKSVSSFYLISSIPFDDIQTDYDFVDVDIKDNTLVNIEQNEKLKENAYSNKTFYNAQIETYNNRLHLYNYKYKLPLPTDISLQNSYTTSDGDYEIHTIEEIFVCIQTDDGEKIVDYSYSTETAFDYNFFFFSYPDSRATKAYIACRTLSNSEVAFEIPLKKHNTLNMAYYVAKNIDEGIFGELDYINSFAEENFFGDNYSGNIESSNTILQSYANMPFAFVDAASSIPCNKLIAIKPQCVALSQGQYGEFPLMAFTDNGIWALSINNEGLYVAKQAVSREIPINDEAILQLDKAITFITDRGVCLMSGSNTQNISEAIYENNTSLTGIEQFKKIITHCKMFYDYAHNRIVFYDNNFKYAYAYYLNHNSWCVIDIDIEKALLTYPSALAISSDKKKVLNFSDEDTTSETDFNLITRPLKLKAPNIFKTIYLIIQRGYLNKGANINQVLYASNDLINWTTVWSSKNNLMNGFGGTPYKFYKIALSGKLNHDDRIVGFTAQYELKGTNKPR